MQAAWPNVKITIRADSGFCRWRLLRWCDSNASTKELYFMAGIVFLADFFGWTKLQAVENFQFRILGDPA
jgi:hypothetical protein